MSASDKLIEIERVVRLSGKNVVVRDRESAEAEAVERRIVEVWEVSVAWDRELH